MASYTKKDGKWSVRFYADGKQKYLGGYASKRDATNAMNDLLNGILIREKDPDAIITYDIAFRSFWAQYEPSVKPHTMIRNKKVFANYITPFFAGLELSEITQDKVAEWYAALPVSDTTKHLYYSKLMILIHYIEDEYDVKLKIRIKGKAGAYHEKEIWTPQQFNAFLEHVEGQYRTMFRLAFSSGMRIGEILALTDKDVVGNTVSVTKNVVPNSPGEHGWVLSTPKTKNSIRKISIPQDVADEIRGLTKQPGFIFSLKKDKSAPISYDKIKRVFKESADAAGLPYIGIHGLRHSHASYLLSSGIPITAVSKRLGHAKVSITLDTYSHMMPSDEDRILAALSAGNAIT